MQRFEEPHGAREPQFGHSCNIGMKRSRESIQLCRSPTPVVNGCCLTTPTLTQTSEQERSDLMDSNRRSLVYCTALNQQFPQLSSKHTGVCFLEIDKKRRNTLHAPKTSQKFMERKCGLERYFQDETRTGHRIAFSFDATISLVF